MGRNVQFDEQSMILHLTGATGILALKRKIEIPYHTIMKVHVDYFDAPRWMLRMPGTSIAALDIFEGSFTYNTEWYFLSYEHKVPLVMLELAGHEKYHYVFFEIDEPTQVAAEIRRRVNS